MATEEDIPIHHLLTLENRDAVLWYLEREDTAEGLQTMLRNASRVQHAIAEKFSHTLVRPLPDIGLRYGIGIPPHYEYRTRPLVCTRDGSTRLTPQNSGVYTPKDLCVTVYAPLIGVAFAAEAFRCMKWVRTHLFVDGVYDAILGMPQEAWSRSTFA